MSLRFALPLVVLCSLVAVAQNSLPNSWVYSSFLGGSKQDGITAQTVDSAGNVYVTGTTTSANFPTTPGVYEPNFPGPYTDSVIFVAKFSPEGALVWSTYLGPGCYIYVAPTGLAVDSEQNVYIGGVFECGKFPATLEIGGPGNVFLAKLNSTGTELVYSAIMGGPSIPPAPPLVVVGTNGNAFISGTTDSGCCNDQTGIIGTLGGIDDFWVAEFNSAGTALTWSVEIGGTGQDESYGMAIDSSNKLYLAGYSSSLNFPVTSGALNQPGGSAFVVKLDPSKSPTSSMVYAALVGNPNSTGTFIEPFAIAIDASGDTYVSNWTYNNNMYTSPAAFQPKSSIPPDGYVFELNPTASAIINGTYLGGGGADYATAVSVDSAGNIYVSGFTNSWDFPFTAYGNPGQAFNNELGYYVKLNPQFAAVSSVLFGPNGTNASASTPDGSGGAWVSGYTQAGFFTTLNAYQPQDAGGYDGYLLHTNFAGLCETSSVAICAINPATSSSQLIQFTAQTANVEGTTSMSLAIDGQIAYTSHSAQFDVWLPVALGNHTATVIAEATGGSTQRAQQPFWVEENSACPLNPVLPSLTICSPLNAASVTGSVSVVVEANDGAAPPATIKLYVDNAYVATLQNQNGTYTDKLTLSAGPHTIAVSGKDPNNDYLHTNAVFKVAQ